MIKPFCCYIEPGQDQGCNRDADFAVHYGPRPDDYTEGCAEHIGLLLADDVKHATLARIA